MILPVLIDVAQLQSTWPSSRLVASSAHHANHVELRPPASVVASYQSPVFELAGIGPGSNASTPEPTIRFAETEWTNEQEQSFLTLACQEAVGELTADGRRELDRLSAARRTRKNPRRGEELIREYEHRQLTRDLVRALERYVTFLKPSSRQTDAEA